MNEYEQEEWARADLLADEDAYYESLATVEDAGAWYFGEDA